MGHLNLLLGWCLLLQLFLVIAIPIFFFCLLIFAEGAIWSPSTFFCFWVGNDCSSVLSSSFIGDFGLVTLVMSLLLLLLSRLLGGSSQSFLSSKRFPEIFPSLDHGVLLWTGASCKVGVYFMEFLLVPVV